jgi:ribosomal protein S5
MIPPPLLPKRRIAKDCPRRSAGAPARETTTSAIRAAMFFNEVATLDLKIPAQTLHLAQKLRHEALSQFVGCAPCGTGLRAGLLVEQG